MDKKVLEQIFASGVLNEDTKKAITATLTEAVAAAKADARKEVTAEFKKNKSKVYETIEKYIEDRIAGPVTQLREEAEQLEKLKGQYADKIVTVEESVKAEFNKRWKALVGTMTAVMEREIGELHESEKINRRAYLKAINEAESKKVAEREQFKQKAALVLENILDVRVQKHLDEHEADLKAAMQSDFGTEIFETFRSTFMRHWFSTNKEARNLAEALQRSEAEKKTITEAANKRIKDAEKRALLAESSRKKIVETQARATEMNRLLAPLKGAARDKMKALLEASPNVESMKKTYTRFLPDVISETTTVAKQPVRAAIDLKTGGATKLPVVESAEVEGEDDDLVDLRRRSGVAAR